MPIFRNFQTNFSGGLLSDGMLGRVDLAQYENGCKELKNWWPKVTGGMRRRPGTTYLNTREFATRIEPFIFSETQVYLFAFWDDPLSTTDGVSIYDADTGALIQFLDLSMAWSDTIIKEMSITQTADVMLLAHPSWKPRLIRRTSATTFAEETFDFEAKYLVDGAAYPKTMPFIKYADSEVTIACSGYLDGANVTVTASAAYFTDALLETAIRYRGKQIYIATANNGGLGSTPQTTVVGTILEELDRGTTLTVTGNGEDFLIDEIIVGRDSGTKGQVVDKSPTSIVISTLAGVFPMLSTEEIEGLSSGNIATITGNTNINPPASAVWDEEAFTDSKGWPSVIEFHAQRLWLAGSSSLPAHIFGSRAAAFFNFDTGDAFPADSIQAVISDKQVNMINDIVSGRHLQVFTDGGEFYAPQSEDLPLQPETFDLRKQTRYGSNSSIEPKIFDESTLFVQAQGNAVREFIWVDNLRGYSSDAISLISEEHLNDIQEVEVLYGGYDRPEQIAFFVNGDGTISWYHAARAEGIRAWGQWTTAGEYKSLAVIQDKLYCLVDRTIDGTTYQMLERFELHLTVDSAITKVSVTAVSGFTAHALHLKNTEVDVVVAVSDDSAGSVGGPQVADQELDADFFLGNLTIGNTGDSALAPAIAANPVTNMTVGLPYTQTLETMPIEVKDRQGVSGGMPKRLVSADVYMLSTLAIKLEGNRVLTFNFPADFATRPVPITGPRKFYLLGYSERPTLTIENEIPLPCEALALGCEVEY